MRSLLRCLRRARRALLLVALVTGLGLSPVLALAGQLDELQHELREVAAGGHTHVDHHPLRHAHDHAGGHDDGGAFHSLTHCVHSCGGAFALLPSALPPVLPAMHEAVVAGPATARANPPPVPLLRPPRIR